MPERKHPRWIIQFLVVLCLSLLLGSADAEPLVWIDPDLPDAELLQLAATVTPQPRQVQWQELETIAFIHFGMNTFTGNEWGDGSDDPRLFNPTGLDADQWATVLKDAGFKLVIFTAKHHDGFCLWPSEYTDYDISASPYRDGNGDLVREFTDACYRHGLQTGLYLSPWDRHHPDYGSGDAYNDYFANQLTELLTQYGPFAEVWFDGAGRDHPNEHGQIQQFDDQRFYRIIRELAPQAVIVGMGPDARWVGNEEGYAREAEWSVVPLTSDPGAHRGSADDLLTWFKPRNRMEADLGSIDALRDSRALFWYPAEVDVSIRPGWFYSASDDGRVKTVDELVNIYFRSVGRNSVLLLNVPPDQSGRIQQAEIEVLQRWHAFLESTFRENLARTAKIHTPQDKRPITILTDGDWRTAYPSPSDSHTDEFIIEFDRPVQCNRLLLHENVSQGQRIEDWRLDSHEDGRWRTVVRGTSVGYKRLERFPMLTTDKLRFVIETARLSPHLGEIGLYRGPEILSPPQILRSRDGDLSFRCDSPDPEIHYTLDGSEPTVHAPRFHEPVPFPDGGTVRAIASTSDRSLVSGPVSESFGPAKSNWSVLFTDSYVPGFRGEMAIDSDRGTMWHTPWTEPLTDQPHEIVIDLGRELRLEGVVYYPRIDGLNSGSIADYELYLLSGADSQRDVSSMHSPAKFEWGAPVNTGAFENMRNHPGRREILFPASPVRYIRFVSTREVDGQPWTSIAEIDVIEAKE